MMRVRHQRQLKTKYIIFCFIVWVARVWNPTVCASVCVRVVKTVLFDSGKALHFLNAMQKRGKKSETENRAYSCTNTYAYTSRIAWHTVRLAWPKANFFPLRESETNFWSFIDRPCDGNLTKTDQHRTKPGILFFFETHCFCKIGQNRKNWFLPERDGHRNRNSDIVSGPPLISSGDNKSETDNLSLLRVPLFVRHISHHDA